MYLNDPKDKHLLYTTGLMTSQRLTACKRYTQVKDRVSALRRGKWTHKVPFLTERLFVIYIPGREKISGVRLDIPSTLYNRIYHLHSVAGYSISIAGLMLGVIQQHKTVSIFL